MIPSFIVLVLTVTAGTVGYGILFDTIFFFRRPRKTASLPVRLFVSLLGPPMLAAVLVFGIGTPAGDKPLHSWRVLLLPYIYNSGWDSWFKEIRLDEPWDSEYNKRFHRIPKSRFPGRDFSPFCCPDAVEKQSLGAFIFEEPDDKDTDRCHYSVIVSPNGLFSGAKVGGKDYSRNNNYADQFLVVERRTPICWMDPTHEITEAEAENGVNTAPDGIGSTHHPGAYVLYGDQHIELLPPGPLKKRQRAGTHP